jgi:ribosomal protein L18
MKESNVATDPVRKLSRDAHRRRIHLRVRTRVSGTPERPRLSVYRSNGHIYAQVIEDRTGRTLVSASSLDTETRKDLKGGSNVAAAKVIGKKSRSARAPRASSRWCSTAAVICITAAWKPWPRRPGKRG